MPEEPPTSEETLNAILATNGCVFSGYNIISSHTNAHVRVALEEACRKVCDRCDQGVPMRDRGRFQSVAEHDGGWLCKAWRIRSYIKNHWS